MGQKGRKIKREREGEGQRDRVRHGESACVASVLAGLTEQFDYRRRSPGMSVGTAPPDTLVVRHREAALSQSH